MFHASVLRAIQTVRVIFFCYSVIYHRLDLTIVAHLSS